MLAGRKSDWFTLHSTQLTHQVGFYDRGWIRKKFSPWGRNFFVLDGVARQYLKERFGVATDAIVELHHGVDCARFRVPTSAERAAAREEFGVGRSEMFVVFVGRLHPAKQPDAIIRAATRARRECRMNLKFAIVGDGEMRQCLESQLQASDVAEMCKMYPWMSPLHAYFAADLVVMPSLYEGFGLVGAEAIATGCPVLRSRTGGCFQMIREGVSGFECDTSHDSFLEKLFSVLEHPDRLHAMRAPARRWAEDHLNVAQQAVRVLEAYRERIRCC
jgi:glycosyltransferase involved in cell wall biosynthesis